MGSARGSGARSRTTFLAIAIGEGDRGVAWTGGRGWESGPPAADRERQGSAHLKRSRRRRESLCSARPAFSLMACLPDRERIKGSAFSKFGEGAPGRRRV